MRRFDLAVIGAGPAGMAAAVEAAHLGLSVLVVDEQPAPGGQVFRAVEAAGGDPALTEEFPEAGGALVRAFRAAEDIAYWPRATLWHVDLAGGVLSVLRDGVSEEVAATRLLLATGAQERPVPVPGWTLPGVMGAGAAQILLKTAGAVPRGPVVIAGQGPLAWLLAVQLLRAGAGPMTLLETGGKGALWDALRAGGLWTGRRLLRKGLSLVREARRHGLRVVRRVRNLQAGGEGRVRRVRWDGGEIACDTLLLHEGVIPSTHIGRALGLEHRWDEAQRCWRPVLDEWGASSHGFVAVAGDGGGIGGWEAAVATGHLAAIDAARRMDRLPAAECARRARPYQTRLASALALRPFLDRLYAPAPEMLVPPDDATIICRCEEVTAGQVRLAARLGATGPNQVKAYLRAGMGPCQGRMCGGTVAAVIAEERGIPIAEAGALRPRAPFKPLTVGELAALPPGDVA
ncbi:FAD-dependent oxidoreductase [Roseomonas sp. SSH11]|uniref:FAD-dependent oxidoreductase n=1 Tax=Pararoseomonas baculiformis TaxID=2820812 RepID=A0ABS4AH27_9PROT|nr:NAD(P)/FAD-dependent oxidoreductase [Pararoseomonas baculiformis]MBP0446313.1 FAD-dependent oxidoreductase [Pararoseomonas baculiformis]